MRIACIVDGFPQLSETFILNQITGLLDRGHDVTIVASHRTDSSKRHEDVDAYKLMERVRYFDIPERKLARCGRALKLFITHFHRDPLKLLKALNVFVYGKDSLNLRILYWLIPFFGKQYDIIHCHFGPNGIIGAYLKTLGIPGRIVTTFYGYDVSQYPRDAGRNAYSFLAAQGDFFIAISSFIAKRAQELGIPEDRIARVPLGISLEFYTFQKKQYIPGEPVKIVSVARLVEKKGIEYSVRAVGMLVKKYPHILYQIAGDGPLRGKIQDLIGELNLETHVKLLGWKTREEVLRLYESSHIFVLASVTDSSGDQEGQGVVLQEAQAMGLPVVVTSHNGFPEGMVDGKSGFLVPERDAESLAGRLDFLIGHPEVWPEMGAFGRAFVEDQFDSNSLNDRLAALYRAVIEKDSEALVV